MLLDLKSYFQTNTLGSLSVMVKKFYSSDPRSDPEEGSNLSNLPLRRVWPNRNAAAANSLAIEASRLGLYSVDVNPVVKVVNIFCCQICSGQIG
jgi:hypothetical protein